MSAHGSHSHKISAAMSQIWDKIASAQICLCCRQLLPKFGQTLHAAPWVVARNRSQNDFDSLSHLSWSCLFHGETIFGLHFNWFQRDGL
jgi:hypothetical protein